MGAAGLRSVRLRSDRGLIERQFAANLSDDELASLARILAKIQKPAR